MTFLFGATLAVNAQNQKTEVTSSLSTMSIKGWQKNIDSLTTATYTEWKDASPVFGGVNPNITYQLYSPATTGDDSVRVILQSRFKIDSSAYVIYNVDTIATVTSVNSRLGLGTNKLLTFGAFGDEIRMLIEPTGTVPNRNDMQFFYRISATQLAPVPFYGNYGNK